MRIWIYLKCSNVNIDSLTSSANTVAIQIGTGTGYQTYGTTTITHLGSSGNGGFYSIPLSLPTEVTTHAAFRLLFFNESGTGNWNGSTRIDDLTVHGSVIPEPSILAFVPIGLAFIAKRRRTSL